MDVLRGFISCSIVTSGPDNFIDQQLQQWSWTNNPPITISSQIQMFDAMWSVIGSGSKIATTTSTSPNGQVHTQTNTSIWTTNGSKMVQLQVRQGSNAIILANVGTISYPNGYQGTQQLTIDGVMQTQGPISGAVYAPALPQMQWSSRTDIFVGAHPTGQVGSPSPQQIGSRLGQSLGAIGNSFAGTLQQPLSSLSGIAPPGGTTSTATWRWRIYT